MGARKDLTYDQRISALPVSSQEVLVKLLEKHERQNERVVFLQKSRQVKLSDSIRALYLPTRVQEILLREDAVRQNDKYVTVKTIADLCNCREYDFRRSPDLGKRSIELIKEALATHGLALLKDQ